MHGLTEAFRSTYLDPSQLKIRPESIGKANSWCWIICYRWNGNECPPRVVGELIHIEVDISYKGFLEYQETKEKKRDLNL